MYNKYQFNKNVLNEIIQLCNEKINRDFEDEELTKFLISNPNYSFNEGKSIFDDIVKGTEQMIK
ncbi:MAG: hypothetical protein J6R47_03350, partial [Acholeplasmatales bacterium]|nr:hypothetical protein [Acholeplasmatales bacterium]